MLKEKKETASTEDAACIEPLLNTAETLHNNSACRYQIQTPESGYVETRSPLFRVNFSHNTILWLQPEVCVACYFAAQETWMKPEFNSKSHSVITGSLNDQKEEITLAS